MCSRKSCLLLNKFYRLAQLHTKTMTDVQPTNQSLAETSFVNNCLFCNIVKENDVNKIVYDDNEIVAFADIKPAAKFHYLIVPKCHITDAKSLTSQEDKALVNRLVNIAKDVLQAQNADVTNARYGFHWPPFHSISHLHLHAISPATDMGFMARLIFKPNSYWFVTPDYVLSRL